MNGEYPTPYDNNSYDVRTRAFLELPSPQITPVAVGNRPCIYISLRDESKLLCELM